MSDTLRFVLIVIGAILWATGIAWPRQKPEPPKMIDYSTRRSTMVGIQRGFRGPLTCYDERGNSILTIDNNAP